MDELDYWRLAEELNVVQAALLTAGGNPSRHQVDEEGRFSITNLPKGFDAVRDALANAVNSGRLKATIRHSAWTHGWTEPPEGERDGIINVKVTPKNEAHTGRPRDFHELSGGVRYYAEPSWLLTTVRVDDLRAWLQGRGFSTGFFFESNDQVSPYLDKKHPRYAPKLAAAIHAWLAWDGEAARIQSPKQSLMRWLREHAGEFDLVDANRKPNETGIEEVAKVANWKREGGAPKTPGS
jgi:hypothetical protein